MQVILTLVQTGKPVKEERLSHSRSRPCTVRTVEREARAAVVWGIFSPPPHPLAMVMQGQETEARRSSQP